jgi:hypothetical protein
MQTRKRLERWALVGLFLLSFLLQAVQPVSRPLQWYYRSVRFMDALLHGDLGGTVQSLHPGVTAMWLVGGAEWLVYGALRALGQDPAPLLNTENRAIIFEINVGVIALALAIALCTVLSWKLLAELFDRRVAWVAALLITLDPFYIANGKVLHLDALLTALMFLASLICYRYLRTGLRRDLVLCGLVTGLSLLNKSPAIFLLLFVPLMLAIGRGRDLFVALKERDRQAGIDLVLKGFLGPLALWLGVTVLTIFLFWPATWVDPAGALGRVWNGALKHAGRAHPHPLLFLGEVTERDPGLSFYVITLLFKTTYVSLPLFVVGLVSAVKARKEERITLLGLALYLLFFGLQMSLANKKAPRYLLPAFPVIDVFAGYGLVILARRAGQGLMPKRARAASTALTMVLVVSHGLGGLLRHPYYGTLYNGLMGGARVGHRVFAPQEEAEGVDQLGRYVNEQPDAGSAVASVHYQSLEMLRQYYGGPIAPLTEPIADYRIFMLNYTLRGAAADRWGELWDTYRFRVPERTVSFDGLTYASLYREHSGEIPASFAEIPVAATFDNRIQLLGYSLDEPQVWPGQPLLLALYWQAADPMPQDYTVFVHVLSEQGNLLAQQDNQPARATRPTYSWAAGEVIEDTYEIPIPPDTAPGNYRLVVGMYELATGERLPVADATGASLPHEQVLLASVEVEPWIPASTYARGIAWLGLIAFGLLAQWLRERVSPPREGQR